MYTKLSSEDISAVTINVDDIIIGSNSREHIDEIKASLSKHYDMKDLGKLNHFLSVNVVQTEGEIFVNESSYVEKYVKKIKIS